MPEPSFVLQHIRCCGGEKGLSPTATALPRENHSTSGRQYSTEILLKVGEPASPAAAGNFPDADTPMQVCYMCPTYILQAGCPALRELLVTAFQENLSEVGDADKETSAKSTSGAMLTSALPPVSVDLPLMGKEVFEVVAVYLEHFYALHYSTTTATATVLPITAESSDTYLASPSGHVPSPLRRPLSFDDLYALSTWEHYYVLCQLLGLTRSQVDSLLLTKCGAWVDFLGGAAALPLSEGETQGARMRTAPDAALAQKRAECFSFSNRRRMWSRLCKILDAAVRLGMPSLRLLCATVAANMLVDLDATSFTKLMQCSEGESGAHNIPRFTEDAREKLLERFPWLKRT